MLFEEQEELRLPSASSFGQPLQAPDVARSMEQRFNQEQRLIDLQNKQIQRRNEVDLYNSKQSESQLAKLGDFSVTAAKVATDILRKKEEGDRINNAYDNVFGDIDKVNPQLIEEETAVSALGQAQVAPVSAAVVEADQSSLAEGEVIRTTAGSLSRGVYVDKGSALNARSLYGPWLSSYLQNPNATITINGQQHRVPDILASGNLALVNVVLRQSRRDFFEAAGLSGVSRKEVVETLLPTMLNTEQQMFTGIVNEGIKTTRQNERDQVGATGFTIGQNYNPETFQSDFQTLRGSYLTTGLSGDAANQEALKAILPGLVASGNVEGLEDLEGEVINPAAPAEGLNTFGGRYGDLISRAKQDAQIIRDKRDRNARGEVTGEMHTQLAQVPNDPAARRTIIDTAITRLRDLGLDEEAAALQAKAGPLISGDASNLTYQELSDKADAGLLTDQDLSDNANLLTPSQIQDLKAKREASKQFSPNTPGRTALDTGVGRAETKIGEALGLEKDFNGNWVTSASSNIDRKQWDAISPQIETDLRNRLAAIRAQNPGASESELAKLYQDEVTNFIEKELGEGGKYDVTFKEDATGKVQSESSRKAWRVLASDSESLTAPPISEGSAVRPRNFTSQVTLGGDVPETVIENFNPLRGDVIFDSTTTETLVSDWNKGKVNQDLLTTASQLGVPPLQLLQSQSAAYSLDQPSIDQSLPNKIPVLAGLGLSTPAITYVSKNTVGLDAPTLSERIQGLPQQYRDILNNPAATRRQLSRVIPMLFAAPVDLPPATPIVADAAPAQPGVILNRTDISSTMRQAGWPEELVPLGTRIALAESGGNSGTDTVQSGLDPNRQNEYSIGLFQVNYKAHKPMLDEMGISEADLRDPLINAKVALKIYQMQGWQAWGAYTNGSYLRY